MISEQDPFPLLQKDLEDCMITANQLHDRYHKGLIIHSHGNQNDSDINLKDNARSFNKLQRYIKDVLKDMNGAMEMIDLYPERFNISQDEIISRKSFIDNINNTLSKFEADFNRISAISESPNISDLVSPLHTHHMDNTDFSTVPLHYHSQDNTVLSFDDQLSKQQDRLIHQEDQLDSLSNTVGNIRQHAYQIHSELQDQVILLNEMEDHVDHVDNRFQSTYKKLQGFVIDSKKSSGGRWIIVLVILLITTIVILIIV